MIFLYIIIVVAILIVIETLIKGHATEYCCIANSTIYKYVCKAKTLENGKIYNILQSTKDASYLGVTNEELNKDFK
jgi:hypothetical protein